MDSTEIEHLPYTVPGYKVMDERDLPTLLWAFTRVFRYGHPNYGTEYGAQDRCIDASAAFIDLLLESRYLIRDDPARSNYGVDEVWVQDGRFGHYAAQVDDYLIDFTARQFDPEADFPLVWRKA